MINQGKVAYSLVSFHVEMEAYKQQGCAQEFLSAGRSVLRGLGEGSQGRTAKFQNTPYDRPTPLTSPPPPPSTHIIPSPSPISPPQFIRILSSSRQGYAKFEFFLG